MPPHLLCNLTPCFTALLMLPSVLTLGFLKVVLLMYFSTVELKRRLVVPSGVERPIGTETRRRGEAKHREFFF